jgi:hypothetical protein
VRVLPGNGLWIADVVTEDPHPDPLPEYQERGKYMRLLEGHNLSEHAEVRAREK